MVTENDNNNEFEIIMGDDVELNFSGVGDIMNDLKPNTSKKHKNIIIPTTKKKEKNNKENKK